MARPCPEPDQIPRMASPERRVALDPSRTAETTATQRAGEQHQPPDRRLLEVPYARHLVRRRAFRLIAGVPALARAGLRVLDRRYPGLHAAILLRAAYADRVIEGRGGEVEQVILMGAGFDSRGEPYLLGFTADALEQELAAAGFELAEHLRIPDLAERVGPPAGVWCSTDDWVGVALAERTGA